MSFVLSMSGVIVGRSDLEHRDAERGLARGAFRPALGYELVQPVLDLYPGSAGDGEAMERYRRAREALRLRLVDGAGTPVTIRDVHITAVESGSPTSGYEIEIETDDPRFWEARPDYPAR